MSLWAAVGLQEPSPARTPPPAARPASQGKRGAAPQQLHTQIEVGRGGARGEREGSGDSEATCNRCWPAEGLVANAGTGVSARTP